MILQSFYNQLYDDPSIKKSAVSFRLRIDCMRDCIFSKTFVLTEHPSCIFTSECGYVFVAKALPYEDLGFFVGHRCFICSPG